MEKADMLNAVLRKLEETAEEIRELLSQVAAVLSDDSGPIHNPIIVMAYPSPAIHLLPYFTSGFT